MGNRIEALLLVDIYVAEGRFDDAEAMSITAQNAHSPPRRAAEGDLLVAGDIKGQEQPMRRSSRCSKMKTGFGRKRMSSRRSWFHFG